MNHIIDWGENGGFTNREEDNTFTGERTFFALAAGPDVRELDVEMYELCPRRGDDHPTEEDARCTSVRVVRRTPGNRLFDVTCTYSNRFDRPDEKNPLDRRAKIRMRTQIFEIPSRVDRRGRAVQTTAGEPLEGYTLRVAGRVISIQKNLSVWPDWALDYAVAINSDVVRIRGRTFPPRTLRMGAIDIGDEDFENQVRFFSLAYELEHNPMTWIQPKWNRGFYQLIRGFERTVGGEKRFVREQFDAEGKLIPPPRLPGIRRATRVEQILLEGGDPPSEPQWLDAAGRWLPDPEPEDVLALEFADYDELPFNRLPLT